MLSLKILRKLHRKSLLRNRLFQLNRYRTRFRSRRERMLLLKFERMMRLHLLLRRNLGGNVVNEAERIIKRKLGSLKMGKRKIKGRKRMDLYKYRFQMQSRKIFLLTIKEIILSMVLP